LYLIAAIVSLSVKLLLAIGKTIVRWYGVLFSYNFLRKIMKNKTTLNQVEDINLLKFEYLHPKYFGSWFFISILFICSFLPFKMQWQVSRGFAFLAFHLVKSRRHVVQVNVDICFSEKSAEDADSHDFDHRFSSALIT
jgi:hypothetical protein